jgi:hypothetical protein
MAAVFVIAIGATMVAKASAVVEDCALALEAVISTMAADRILEIVFICLDLNLKVSVKKIVLFYYCKFC